MGGRFPASISQLHVGLRWWAGALMVLLGKKVRFGRRVRLIVAHREATGRTLGAVAAFPHWQRRSCCLAVVL